MASQSGEADSDGAHPFSRSGLTIRWKEKRNLCPRAVYVDESGQDMRGDLFVVAVVVVLIDALPPSQAERIGNLLRQGGVPVKKVRGVRRDENDPFIRLADALCGLVRAAYEEQPEMLVLFEKARQSGIIKDLSQQ
jgi:hypothetical protein